MDTSYDIVVLGSGLKETLLAFLLAFAGKSVLVIDRNSYYGGEAASFDLRHLLQMTRPNQQVPAWAMSRYWNVDLVPKLLRGNSELAALLQSTIGQYIEWQSVGFVPIQQLLGQSEQRAGEPEHSLLREVWDSTQLNDFWASLEKNPPESDLPFSKMIERLDSTVANFLEHARPFDEGPNLPRGQVNSRIKEFAAKTYSDFLYPCYGSGGYSEGFSRLCAIHGALLMLNRPLESILFNANGRVRGVQSMGETVLCSAIVCDSSYVASINKVKKVYEIVRAVCILDHPVPYVSSSAYFVIPHSSVGRKHDIYVIVLSAAQQVCPPGFFIATVSTVVETSSPASELQPGLDLLGTTLEVVTKVYDYNEANTNGKADGIFVLNSLDETNHLEGVVEEVKRIYLAIAEKPLSIPG